MACTNRHPCALANGSGRFAFMLPSVSELLLLLLLLLLVESQ
jgi:hypothetical protein